MALLIFLVPLAVTAGALLFVYSGAVQGIPGNTLQLLVLTTLTVLTVWQCKAMAQAPHHHQFHRDFYRHWKQPGTNVSCCDARVMKDGREAGDCEPTRAEIRAGAWWAWLRQESRWVEIPDARIIRERSPNVTDAHLCWNYGQVLCFVPPATGG